MSKLLKNKIILGALLSSCALSAGAVVGDVEDSVMRGLRGAMSAVDLPMRVARERSEDLYAYNVQNGDGAQALGAAVDLLTGATNQYISALSICTNYFVKMTFATGTRFESGEMSGATVPLHESMFGKIILHVPVYDTNDYRITTWECLTNFTMDNAIFQGDSKEGTQMQANADTATAVRSIISKYTNDPISEKCVYSASGAGSVWDVVLAAAGTCVNS